MTLTGIKEGQRRDYLIYFTVDYKDQKHTLVDVPMGGGTIASFEDFDILTNMKFWNGKLVLKLKFLIYQKLALTLK